MNKYLLSFLILTMTIPTIADGHSNAEKTVIANVEAYWDARNKKDFKTVVALSSKAGMLGTNSDGSFHKPNGVQTADEWAATTPKNAGVINVFGSEAHQLTNNVVYSRYYAEGLVPDGNGGLRPYRTRVTSVWVKEGSNWVVRTNHFSSAAYGGVHQTAEGDFED